ncbi:MAG: trypsin-like peptidase domain-containing protein [Phycisphaerae bacterium]
MVRVFQKASPAVVNLSTTQIVTVENRFGMGSIFDEIFDWPGLRRPRRFKTQSVGSGFLIHGDGYLVTNAHVVDRATECKVTFADGTELMAQEVAIDRRHDLAVLKVQARKQLPYLKMHRSDDLMPGETVIAIGNPLGYQNTITTGIISALNRELRFDDRHVYSGLIQTDASINPGNSGGPLLNVLGELIGINTAIRGDAQNIGFAIPVSRLRELLPVMLDIERLRPVRFGIHFDGRQRDSGPPGVRIERVAPDTPAAKAGVHAGDIVVAIDNQPTPTFMHVFGLLKRSVPGQSLKLDLVRADGKRTSVEVPLADIPKQDAAGRMASYFGLTVRELTRADMTRLGLRGRIGLVIEAVRPGSDAAHQKLYPDDIITKFGGWPVPSFKKLSRLIEQVKRGDRIPLQILRIGEDSYVRFELVLRAR